jgi:hypothetical protein
MSAHLTTPPGSRECATINEMLAWYANGTLGAVDRAVVDHHLQSCVACQAALVLERRIVESMRAPRDNVEQSPHAGWQKMVARLDAQEGLSHVEESGAEARFAAAAPREAPTVGAVSRADSGRRRVNWPAALGAAVAVQAAAIAVLTIALVHRHAEQTAPRFQVAFNDPTLAMSGELVRIQFDPSVDEPAALGIAAGVAAKRVLGPSRNNLYTFVFPEEMAANGVLDDKVNALRAQSHVLFVDRVIREPQPHRE